MTHTFIFWAGSREYRMLFFKDQIMGVVGELGLLGHEKQQWSANSDYIISTIDKKSATTVFAT